MSHMPICPQGHSDGRVNEDGIVEMGGRHRDRYRCNHPDGSYHRFLAAPAPETPRPPFDRRARIDALVRGMGVHAADDDQPTLWSPRRTTAGGPPHRVPDGGRPRAHRMLLAECADVEATAALRPLVDHRAERRVAEPVIPVRTSRPAAADRVFVLPSPPTDEEKYWYLGRQKRWYLWAGTAAGTLVLISLVRFAVDQPLTWAFLVLVALRLVTSVVGLISSSRRRRTDGLDHESRVLTWLPEAYPSVDVFLPSAGEPLDILANTYLHVSRLEWPGRLTVHVLDDSARSEVADLAAGYGFVYRTRPNRGFLKKAGNLKYGFDHSRGDLIAIFDADFVPRPEYLRELVPYFEDPAVGIVQSPQFFDTGWGMNWLQRAAGATQELFYRFVQPSRDAVDAAICVGTCAIYRRAALEKSGGFAQIGHSEDVHTGVNLLKVGFFVRYVPVLVSKGLCPDSLSGFLNQQYRWCTGSMSLLFDRKFHAAPLSLKQRLCFWSGFLYYISTGVFVFTVALPSLVMLWFLPQKIEVDNYRLLLPALVVTYALTPLVLRCRWRPEVLRVQMIYSFAHAVAVWHTLRRRTADWVPTGAAGKGTPLAVTIRRVMTVTIVLGQGLLWGGIAHSLPTIGVGRLWPMIVLGLVMAYVQIPALFPLRSSRPDGAVRRPPYPSAAKPIQRDPNSRAVRRLERTSVSG